MPSRACACRCSSVRAGFGRRPPCDRRYAPGTGRPEGRSAALGALLAAAGGGQVLLGVTERPSSAGNYVSLRVRVHLQQAETVLDVYEVLREVEQVITVL